MANTTDAAELRGMSRAELDDKVRQLKEELFSLRFAASTGQLKTHCCFCGQQCGIKLKVDSSSPTAGCGTSARTSPASTP